MFKHGLPMKNMFSEVTTRCAFSSSSVLRNSEVLPSTPEMKSEAWSSGPSNDMDITKKVIGMARSVQEKSQPPIIVDSKLVKNFSPSSQYNAFDFSMTRMVMERKWTVKNSRPQTHYKGGRNDVFKKAGIDPRDLYLMPEILSRFVSSAGQILPREITGCTDSNQKKLGIAIKRARTAGLLPSTTKHSRFTLKRIL